MLAAEHRVVGNESENHHILKKKFFTNMMSKKTREIYYKHQHERNTCAIIVAMRSMMANNKPLGGVFEALGKDNQIFRLFCFT